MLYDFHSPQTSRERQGSGGHTEWMPSGGSGVSTRRGAYRIFVTCLTTSAQRVQLLVTRNLQARGATVRVRAQPPVDSEDHISRTRIVFSVDGANLRGAIAALINLLGADTCVRAVRWESNPGGA